MAKDFSNVAGKVPIGIRNNNPGNVRPLGRKQMWVGQTGKASGFAVFQNIAYGIRAMAKNAITQVTKNGNNTVAKYVTAYAPPHENDTAGYIRSVGAALGLKANEVIPVTDISTMQKLIRIHITKEIGQFGKYITDADILEGIALINENIAIIPAR